MEKAVIRIIDANFNRAREGLRVVEEFCRFYLNSKPFSARCKSIRHKLSGVIKQFDNYSLLSARDTVADVGTDIKVGGQLSRTALFDVFTAAAKRVPEALRVISEMTAIDNPDLAAIIEQARYEFYTLEKEVSLFASSFEKFSKVGLYVLITSANPAEILSLTVKCAKGNADCIQLRTKGGLEPDIKLLETASEFVKICRDYDVISIINDRPDIAVCSNADGFHLGQDDIPIEQANKLIMEPKIIGKSTHNVSQLQNAIKEMPAYVGLGPAFETATKPNAKTAGLDYITKAIEMLEGTGIWHTAIGGINLGNIKDVINAGAKTVAVCSAITNSADPEKECLKFKEILMAN